MVEKKKHENIVIYQIRIYRINQGNKKKLMNRIINQFGFFKRLN